jgi:2-amino-4-hydroxy-6-hydroxymethyldihydropteridine diphosphokinase
MATKSRGSVCRLGDKIQSSFGWIKTANEQDVLRRFFSFYIAWLPLMQPSASKKADGLIAFGANQGDCEEALNKTVAILEKDSHILQLNCSNPVETQAVTGNVPDEDSPAQATYLNAAIRVLTTWSASELHAAMIGIEKQLGRERAERWGPRTIDLDLLLFGDLQRRQEDLVVPHPRMSFRRFVLQPALDVAANMVHPESGMTLQQLVDHLDNAENRIVLTTNMPSFAESIARDVPYKIQIVENVNQFLSVSIGAKLVVACFDESEIDAELESFVRFASNFAGPTLRINPTLGKNNARTELTAAIEAMT